MKAILEFDLPDDQNNFTLANKGSDFWNCLWNLDQELRGFLKYGHKFKNAADALQWVRDFIQENGQLDSINY